MGNVNAFIGIFVLLLSVSSTTVARGDDTPAATGQAPNGGVRVVEEATDPGTARIRSGSGVAEGAPHSSDCSRGETANTDRFGWLCTIGGDDAEGGEAAYIVRDASGEPVGNVTEVGTNFSYALVDLDLHGKKVQLKVQPDRISFPSPSLGNGEFYFESLDCTDKPWIEAEFLERFGPSWQGSFGYDGISYYQIWDEALGHFSYYEITATSTRPQEITVRAMSFPSDIDSGCYPYPHAVKRDAYKFLASSILDGVAPPFTLEVWY